MKKLQSKIAVITGGNSGIGFASAKLFKSQGATLVIVGRNQETLEAARNELSDDALIIRADISKVSEIVKVVQTVKEKFGRIDVLFANAGISECPPIQETDEAFFNHIFDVNVKGVFFLFAKAMPLFSENAAVIFTCSAAHDMGRPGDPLYAATKAAVRSLARTLAADEEILNKKIRVNVVSPGPIQTPLTKQDTQEMTDAINAYIESNIPMKRWGQAEEVAKAVLFLASNDSSYSTGGEITVDGGLREI